MFKEFRQLQPKTLSNIETMMERLIENKRFFDFAIFFFSNFVPNFENKLKFSNFLLMRK